MNELHIKLHDMVHRMNSYFRGYELIITLSKEDILKIRNELIYSFGSSPYPQLRTYMGINVQVGEFTSVGIKI